TPGHGRGRGPGAVAAGELDFLLPRCQGRTTKPRLTGEPAAHVRPVLTLHRHRQGVHRDRLVISKIPGDADLPIVRKYLRVLHRTTESHRHRRWRVPVVRDKPRPDTT